MSTDAGCSLIIPAEGENDLFLLGDNYIIVVDQAAVAALDFDTDAGLDYKRIAVIDRLVF